MKIIDAIAMIFLIFGGLNWGAVGFADFNVLMYVFIAVPKVQRAIYILMGVSALWRIIFYKSIRRRCCSQDK